MISAESSRLDVDVLSNSSGVSWGAIFAGAAAAAALSLILLILGVGLGFSAISPWSYSGASATTIGISSIIWVAFTQIAASAVGGYLAGRLRVKWANTHNDEVYFRDTAHGLLAWAVASLATAALLGSVISAVVGSGVQVGATAVSGVAGAAAGQMAEQTKTEPVGYYVDSLFRADAVSPAADDKATRIEATTIFAHDLHTGVLSPEDKQYLGKVVAQRTGLSQADAEQRVGALYDKAGKAIADAQATAKQAADTARKATAYSALWMFVTLLCGAFIASLTATFGGKLRDRIDAVTARPLR